MEKKFKDIDPLAAAPCVITKSGISRRGEKAYIGI